MDNNYIQSVIALAPNLFYGTSIATTILVLAKNKTNDTTVQFIDASAEDVNNDGFFKKATNNNVMEKEHIDKILEIFDTKRKYSPYRPICITRKNRRQRL